MITKEVIVSNVAEKYNNFVAALVQKACNFESEIIIESNNRRINAKSIMGVMSLALMNGTEVIIDAEGPDEAAAIASLEAFFTAK